MGDINKAVQFMINTANDNKHGYDQLHRNGPDFDCSSLVATALNKAGFPVSPNSWTGNLKQQLLNCGFKECRAPWKAGDIHLNELKHVCMSINANEIAQASINEKGTTKGGKTGDQTGREIWIRSYYDYPWDIHLRYESKITKATNEEVALQVVRGEYGNGEQRRTLLKANGYDPDVIQSIVNDMLNGSIHERNQKVAEDVIKGKYGNGLDRKTNLEKAGYDYYLIQTLVNEILRG